VVRKFYDAMKSGIEGDGDKEGEGKIPVCVGDESPGPSDFFLSILHAHFTNVPVGGEPVLVCPGSKSLIVAIYLYL
jgi:hypothetical protein